MRERELVGSLRLVLSFARNAKAHGHWAEFEVLMDEVEVLLAALRSPPSCAASSNG